MKKTTALATINVTRIDCIPEDLIPNEKNDQLCTSESQEANMCSVSKNIFFVLLAF